MAAPYSRLDLTKAKYAFFLVVSGQCCRFLLMNPNLELALLQISLIWVAHLRSFEMFSPKYVVFSTLFKISPQS